MLQIPEQLHFSGLVSRIKQETSESVVVAAVVAEETSNGQVDGHAVTGLQVDGHNNSGAVLLVLHVHLSGSGQHFAVDLQRGAGGQGVTRRAGVTEDGEGEAVDTRAGSGEDAGLGTVAVAQVDEDVFVGYDLVVAVGAYALQAFFIGQSDGEGTAAGWRRREEEQDMKFV